MSNKQDNSHIKNKGTDSEALLTLACSQGFILQEELMQTKQTSQKKKMSIEDVLIKGGLLTKRQLIRLQTELKSRRGSSQIHIPGFEIRKKLGSGGMALVLLGHHKNLDREVAIKILPEKFNKDKDYIERFYKEGKAAAKLNHPNIVQAYDVGSSEEKHYFVMEFVDGETVLDKIEKDKKINEKEAIKMCIEGAKALQHAHENGFVHRDVKPANLMLTTNNQIKLADLGLARAVNDEQAAEAESGKVYGTPKYMSPEQVRGEKNIGPATDIYSLGATLYHMVTGREPFRPEPGQPSGRKELMKMHLRQPLTPPDKINKSLGSNICAIIEKMMEKKVSDRYQNCNDLITDLVAAESGQQLTFAQVQIDLGDALNEIENLETIQKFDSKENANTFLFGIGLCLLGFLLGLLLGALLL